MRHSTFMGSNGKSRAGRLLGSRAALAAAVLLAGTFSTFAAEPSDQKLLAGADKRIEKHRKADAVVVVVDKLGKPAAGVQVTVQQTRHAFLFGCNIFKWGDLPNEQLQAAYRKHYADLLNYATLPFYWNSYERKRGQPNHDKTEQVAKWCKEQGIYTKGHPLAWNIGDQPWLPDDLEQIRKLQMARIEDCVTRFRGLIDRWDVVNEATHFDRADFVKRRSPKLSAMWKKVGRIEFTRQCFQHARKAGPKATLLINDYRTDPAFERVIEKLVDADGKRLYDVIGIQSHMHGGTWNNRKIWEVCERFGRFHVPLHFTEATILSGKRGWNNKPPWPSTAEGEAWQARETVRFYTMLFSHPAVEAITWWDFCDFYAWKKAPAGFLRKDMTPKPMYHELKKLIKGKWWTTATLKTDAGGIARFRGFLGDYKVSAAIGPKQAAGQYTLAKGATGRWTLTFK